MTYTSVEAVGAKVQSLFKVDMDEYFIREQSLEALNEMGLLETEDVIIKSAISDYCVNLPKGAGPITRINWAIYAPEIWTSLSVIVQNIWHPSQTIFTPIPSEDAEMGIITFSTPLNVIPDVKGPYIPFSYKCPVMKFNQTDINVVVYAERLKVDKETGFPPIPEDALEACAYNCIETHMRPLFYLGKVPPLVWKEIKAETANRFARAQNNIGFKQLDKGKLSEAMSIAATWDRKHYGIDS